MSQRTYGRDFTELSCELAGAICLKTFGLLRSNSLNLFKNIFGCPRVNLWHYDSCLAPAISPCEQTRLPWLATTRHVAFDECQSNYNRM